MIFAAGLGTRLKPLTDTLPKALVPVAGKPLLEHIILKLKEAGFDEIIINVHHFPDMIIDFIRQNNSFGIRIEISDEREQLLDTGGAIRKAAWFFDKDAPFLVHNVDILSTLNLAELYQYHITNKSQATLVVSRRDTFRYLLFNEQHTLCGWINKKTKETKPTGLNVTSDLMELAFSGIQVLDPSVVSLMDSWNPKFPIMDFYLSNVNTMEIKGFIPSVDSFRMLDVGKIDIIEEAETFFQKV